MAHLTPLPHVAGRVRQEHGVTGVTYSRLFAAAADGRLPGLVRQGGRLFVQDTALADVAAMFASAPVAPHSAA